MGEPAVTTWVELELDLVTFDETPFLQAITNCTRAGIRFATMNELGDTHTNRRRLYELNRTCSADIPGRGAFYTWEEYLRDRIEIAPYRPEWVVIALDGAQWVGMAATVQCAGEGCVFNEMTGVLPGYRRSRIAIAMKVLGIAVVRAAGYKRVITKHHAANTRAIGMNRRLGFVDSATKR